MDNRDDPWRTPVLEKLGRDLGRIARRERTARLRRVAVAVTIVVVLAIVAFAIAVVLLHS